VGAADSYFEKAELALKKHNYDYAIELFLQGLAIDPKATVQRRRLHQIEVLAVQEKGGNPQGGMGSRLKTAGSELQAKKLHLQKKYDEEVLELEKILRVQPQNPGTLNLLALGLEALEVFEGAISTYEEITALDKNNIEAFRKMGKLYDKLGDPDKAIAAWEKVKMYKPEDKEAGKAIRDLSAAQMVKKSEDRKKAAGGDASFRDLLKDQGESEELQKKQQIIRNDDDRRRAIRFKVEEIKKEPTNSRLWRDLGTLFQDLKLWEKAEEAFSKALEVNPQDLYAIEKKGHLKEVRLDQELDDLRKEVAAAGNGTADPALAARLKQKETEVLAFKSEEYLRRVAAHPTDYELKVKYGKILREQAQFDEAIGQFQKSVKDPKLKVVSHTQIGHCFCQKGLFDLAIGQYTLALGGISDQDSEVGKDIRYALADANEKKGDLGGDAQRRKTEYQASIELFQQIMSVDIGYRDISVRVDRLRGKVASLGNGA
jgi:tetratricopeptide (TPR) repeat protein